MTDQPLDNPPPSSQELSGSLPDASPPPRRRHEWGTWIAWGVIVACVGLVMAANIARPKLKARPKQPIEIAEKEAARQGPGIELLLPARYAVGVSEWMRA